MDQNLVDIAIFIIVVGGGALGFVLGAVRAAVPFALVLVVATMIELYPAIAYSFGQENVIKFFLYLLLAFIGLVIFGAVFSLAQRFARFFDMGLIHRVSGLLLGLVTGTLISGVLIGGFENYGGDLWKSSKQDSTLSQPVQIFLDLVMAWTDKIFPHSH